MISTSQCKLTNNVGNISRRLIVIDFNTVKFYDQRDFQLLKFL